MAGTPAWVELDDDDLATRRRPGHPHPACDIALTRIAAQPDRVAGPPDGAQNR